MTRVQFGWSLPSGPPEGMSRNAYMEDVHKGFELIKRHFDSFWFVDHLQVAARYADWWNVSWTGIDTYRLYLEEFEHACTEVQRDPATVRRAWYGGCVCGQRETAVKKLNNNNYSAARAFVGGPHQVIEQMG